MFLYFLENQKSVGSNMALNDISEPNLRKQKSNPQLSSVDSLQPNSTIDYEDIMKYDKVRTETQAEIERSKNRINIFSVYNDLYNTSESITRFNHTKYNDPFCFNK